MLEVTLVSDELEAEPDSCPCFTPFIQRQSQGGSRLSRVSDSEQLRAVVCTCCNSCYEQKKSYAFAACSSSGVRMLPSLISGFYGTLQAQTVTRSVNLKLVMMTVDAGKTHASGNLFLPLFSHALNFCLMWDQLPTL